MFLFLAEYISFIVSLYVRQVVPIYTGNRFFFRTYRSLPWRQTVVLRSPTQKTLRRDKLYMFNLSTNLLFGVTFTLHTHIYRLMGEI